MPTLPFDCHCGTVQGSVSAATPQGGNRAVCFCQSCRAGALYCGADDPKSDGVDLFQVMSHQITITAGHDQLRPFSFGPRNLLRWKACCCGVQMFSTPRSPKMALVGLVTARLADAGPIGAVKSRAFVPKGGGKTAHENLPALIKVAGRMLLTRMAGRWQETPLFDTETLQPIAAVTQISRQERQAILAQGR